MTVVAARLATTYPGQQHRLGRARGRGAGTAGHDREARADADLRRRRFSAADRLRERREPDSGAAVQPPQRDRRARGARRRARGSSCVRCWWRASCCPPSAARSDLFVAWAGVRFVHALPEGSLPRMQEVRLDGGVLLFALAASVCVALVFGLVPALQASRAGLARHDERVLRARRAAPARAAARRARGRSRWRWRWCCSSAPGLMTRSFAQLMRVSPGFEPRNLLAVQIYLPQAKYKTPARSHALLHGCDPSHRRRCRASSRRRPSARCRCIRSGIDFALPFTIEGKAAPANGEEPRADIRMATPGYFETMKMALRQGAVHRRTRSPGRARRDGDQRDDGAAVLRRRGSDRQGRAQSARQGRSRRHRRRRQALRARQRAARRAVHAGVAAAAERHGAHRADGVGSEAVRRSDSPRGAGDRRRAADFRRQHDGGRGVAIGLPAADQHGAARRRSRSRRCCSPSSASTASCRTP